MKNHYHIKFPNEIVVSFGIIDRIEEEVERRGFAQPVYVVGKYTSRWAGDGEKVIVNSTQREELDEIEVEGDVIVGVGGGKNLDAAKYLSMKTGVPYILVPTLPSSDGIASPSISIWDGDRRLSLLYRPPLAIFIDMDVILTSPQRYIMAGYGDVIAKYSSLYDWWLGHIKRGEYFGYFTSRLIKFAVNHVAKNRKRLYTLEGLNILIESLIITGGVIGIQGTSRPSSGSEHLISHALDMLLVKEGERPRPHGLQVGISTIFTSYLQGRRWRAVRSILGDVGHPTRLEDLNLDEDIYVEAVMEAPRIRNRYTILNEVNLTPKIIKNILEEVGMV